MSEEIDLSIYTVEELGYMWGRTFGKRSHIFLEEIFKRALASEEADDKSRGE